MKKIKAIGGWPVQPHKGVACCRTQQLDRVAVSLERERPELRAAFQWWRGSCTMSWPQAHQDAKRGLCCQATLTFCRADAITYDYSPRASDLGEPKRPDGRWRMLPAGPAGPSLRVNGVAST